jgi:serine protease SohB
MEFAAELGLFSGKVFVLVLGIGTLLILIFALIAKARKSQPTLNIENLNKKFESMADALKEAVWDKKQIKREKKNRKKLKKRIQDEDKKRLFVLEFPGDIRATHLENLREEITSLLGMARPGKDEILVRIESGGGMVHAYGLAAAQLVRIREAGIELVVSIDKIAASGGYMMACTAHRVLAAPFAIVGSIGVIAPVTNLHRLLKKHDVDYEELTAGEFKRTVSMLGEITEKGRRKALEQIEDTHEMFKKFVHHFRPQLQLDQVATGEYWYGRRALELKLVDEIVAGDDYLFRQRNDVFIYKVEVSTRKKWSEKLAENIARVMAGTADKAVGLANDSRFI